MKFSIVLDGQGSGDRKSKLASQVMSARCEFVDQETAEKVAGHARTLAAKADGSEKHGDTTVYAAGGVVIVLTANKGTARQTAHDRSWKVLSDAIAAALPTAEEVTAKLKA